MEKLGLLALRDVDANVTLTLDQFVFEDIKIAAATVKATLAGGKLGAEMMGRGIVAIRRNRDHHRRASIVMPDLGRIDAMPF